VADASPQAPSMRWWGWGADEHAERLPAHAERFLRERLGMDARERPPVALADVKVRQSALTEGQRARLAAIVAAEHVREDHGERILHAAGKGYPDLLRMRAGEPDGTPDAVVHPDGHEQVQALLELCAAQSLAVVPFGGGTSVVGGLAPLRGTHAAVVSLDLDRCAALLALDEQSATVTVGAGMRAVALERELGPRGLTLGHFPQSYEYVTLGGCAATRSAGQASTGYGAIEKMVLGLRLAAPAGELALAPLPASAAGPSLRQLLVGSEGTLGVISEVSLRVRAAPVRRSYEGLFFRDFATGVQALRRLALEHALPDVARLSDEHETMTSLALAGAGGVKGRLGRAYLSARGAAEGCLTIVGFEGSAHDVATRRGRVLTLLRHAGGVPVGSRPGRAWLHGRFAAPYLRDELLTRGVLVETLETAAQWSRLGALHAGVAGAIETALLEQGTPGLVMCHVSHLYETGASLYFTLLAPQREGAELEQWRAVKRAAGDAIVAAGGTITHHHAVGRDHQPWMGAEVGEQGLQVLRAAKAQLDPAGIMNPGKLLALSPARSEESAGRAG
jgi:alkyldihydroxyacetonephosphate synthase